MEKIIAANTLADMFISASLNKTKSVSIKSFLLIPVLLLLITPAINSRQPIMEIYFAKYFWLVLAAAFLIPLLIIHTKKQSLTQADLLVILFTVYIYIQYCFSTVQLAESKKLDYFLISALAYFGVKQLLLTNKNKFRFWLLMTIFGTTIVTAVYGILQKAALISPFNYKFHITGTFFQPAAFAGFIAGVFPLTFYICYYFWKSDNSKPYVPVVKIMSLITGSLIILILPSVQSRASIAGLIAGMIFIAGSIEKWKLYIRRIIAKGRIWKILLVSAGFMFFIVAGYRVRESSAEGRLLAWKISLGMIRDKPFWGFGPDAFRYVYPDYQIAYFKSGTRTENEKLLSYEINAPFNEAIHFCCEWGFVGLIIFISIIIAVFKNKGSVTEISEITEPIPERPIRTGAKAALVSWLVFGQFCYPFSLPELTLYFFIFLALADGGLTVSPLHRFKQVFSIIRPVFVILLCAVIFIRDISIFKTWQGVTQWDEAISTTDSVSAHNSFIRAFSFIKNNDLFLSDFAHFLYKSGRYRESAETIHLKKGKLYNDLLLGGEICEKLSMQDSAVEYYKNASFLLPHRFVPVYRLMHIYESKGDFPAAKAAAREILDKKVKIESYEVYTIKNEAILLLQKVH